MAPEIQPKKILLDITFLHDQYEKRGIGRYGKEIFGRLVARIFDGTIENVEVHLMGFGKLEDSLPLLETGLDSEQLLKVSQKLLFHSLGKPQLSRPISNILLYRRQIVPLVEKLKPELYWAVHFDRGLPSDLVTTVVTVHDVIPLVTGQYSAKGPIVNFLKGIFYKSMWRKVKQAKLVLTSSNFSKHDLVNYGDLDAQQLKVVYLGISDVFKKENIPMNTKQQIELLERYDIQTTIRAGEAEITPYLFYDAGMMQNKNTGKLLQVFAKLVSHLPELKLLITSGDFKYDPATKSSFPVNNLAEKFLDQAGELGLLYNLIPTGKITDIEMGILLSQAKAYINLSDYEGFGFGPVQAMAAGVPAIVSNRSCFPEVVEDAALIIEPNNTLESAAKVLELLNSEELSHKYAKKGLELAPKYDWRKTFAETWEEVYQILENKDEGKVAKPHLKLRAK